MQKIKFDFEATKERIYAPNSNVPIGAPVDRNGNIANDGNAYGIVLCKETENEKYWVRYNLVVMVAGYCDIIDAQEIWGGEYSAEAKSAMSDIIFCDDHKIGAGGGWPADLPKPSVGGYGYTEQGEQTVITWDGDTEGREPVFGSVYMVSESAPSQDSVVGARIVFRNGYVLEVSPDIIMPASDSGAMYGILDGDRLACLVAPEDGDIEGDVINKGTYFVKEGNDYPTSLTYDTPGTIHKIDEKYINFKPIVTANFQEVDGELECDTDFATMKEAALENRLVATLDGGRQVFHVSGFRTADSSNCLLLECFSAEVSYEIIVTKNRMSIEKTRYKVYEG